MKEEKHSFKDLIELSSRMMHQYYQGDYEEWFSRLSPQAIWIGTGMPMLFGAAAIRKHFSENYKNTGAVQILKEEYHPLPVSPDTVQIIGQQFIGSPNQDLQIVVLLSLTYHLTGGWNPKLIFHHFSYEFNRPGETMLSSIVQMDVRTRTFIRSIMLSHPDEHLKIPIKCGSSTLFLDPLSILYVCKVGKYCDLVCIDHVVSSTVTLSRLTELLPDNFYPIHRGYLVNLLYVTALTRYEAELVSGIRIPVPAQSYMKIKEDLIRRLGAGIVRKKESR